MLDGVPILSRISVHTIPFVRYMFWFMYTVYQKLHSYQGMRGISFDFLATGIQWKLYNVIWLKRETKRILVQNRRFWIIFPFFLLYEIRFCFFFFINNTNDGRTWNQSKFDNHLRREWGYGITLFALKDFFSPFGMSVCTFVVPLNSE